jgi:diguanylate cyclase (GGDEF)-like protein
MEENLNQRLASVLEAEELKGFARSIAELQLLLVILVLLYFFIPTREITNSDALVVAMISYSTFIIVIRYLNLLPRETRWKLAVETWAMISFISVVLWHTGLVESPLLNLYLLVIIACAITLGKIMTFLEVALIACCYLFMGYQAYATALFAPETFTMMMARFSPFLLVAYVTSMLAADILRAKKKITMLSQTDDLTSLLNMRAFNLVLQKEIACARRYASPFTLVMIDVDGLKTINDRYGHTAGSRLIKAVARSVRHCVRASDVVARYGGDEFVILMANTSTRDAIVPAEHIRKAIHNTTFTVKGKRFNASASIGIASFPDNVADPGEVLEKADDALYQSKQAGRNKVTWFEQHPHSATACA